MALRIIGAGLPRTATLTQKVALEMLGAGPCYHMVTVLADLTKVASWQRALAGDVQWDEMFAGFEATTDWPGTFFYRELIDVYPEAKVLLSVRDPQRWAVSMRDTVLSVHLGDTLIRHLSQARARIEPDFEAYNVTMRAMLFGAGGLFGPITTCPDDSVIADALRRHVDEVKATVPAGRLLVWEVADGWEPLCDFIGVSVPEQPLPQVNDSAMFEDRIIESSLASLNRYWDQRRLAPE